MFKNILICIAFGACINLPLFASMDEYSMAISMNEFWIKSMEDSMDMFMNEYLIKSVDSSIDEQIPLCISLGATCNSALYLRGL